MKINEVMLRGVKGLDRTQKLTGRDIFIGPNGTGKTAIFDAVNIALLGYVAREKGRRPSDAMEYAAGDSMTAGVKTDGLTVERTFTRKYKPQDDGTTEATVMSDLSLYPSRGESGLRAREARVMAETGIAPVMVDLREFLDLSDDKKREFVLTLTATADYGVPVEEAQRRLEVLFANEGDSDLREMGEHSVRKILKDWNPDRVPQLLANLKASTSEWTKKKKEAQAVVIELTSLRGSIQSTRDIAAIKAERDKLQEQLTTEKEQRATINERRKAIDNREQIIENVKSQIQDTSGRITHLKEGETDLNGEISIKRQQLEIQKGDLEENREGLHTDTETRDKLIAMRQESDAEVNKLQGKHETLGADISKVEAITDKGECPIAGVKCDQNFTAYLDGQRQTLSQLGVSLGEAVGKSNDLTGQIEKLNETIKATEAAMRNQSILIETLSSEISRLESDLAGVRSDLAAKRENEESLGTNLAKAEEIAVDYTGLTPAEELDELINGIESRLNELREELEQKEQEKGSLIKLEEAQVRNRLAQNNLTVIKSITEEVGYRGMLGDMVKVLSKPLAERVNEFLSGIDINKCLSIQTVDHNGHEVFQLGWSRRIGGDNPVSHFIPLSRLSTGEGALFLAAILAAVIELRNPPLKAIMIDNIESIDAEHRQLFIDGLAKIGERMDNITLCGLEAVPEDRLPEGWKLWPLAA